MARLRHLVALIALAALVFSAGPGFAMSAPSASAMHEAAATVATDCIHCPEDGTSQQSPAKADSSCCDANCVNLAILAGPAARTQFVPAPLIAESQPALTGHAPPVYLPPPLSV